MLDGHRQVSGKGHNDPRFISGSRERRGACCLGLGVERSIAGTVMISGTGIGRTAEKVCNLIMNREKSLGLTG
jgi:hypothetical protein